jgi:hypothetical protein
MPDFGVGTFCSKVCFLLCLVELAHCRLFLLEQSLFIVQISGSTGAESYSPRASISTDDKSSADDEENQPAAETEEEAVEHTLWRHGGEIQCADNKQKVLGDERDDKRGREEAGERRGGGAVSVLRTLFLRGCRGLPPRCCAPCFGGETLEGRSVAHKRFVTNLQTLMCNPGKSRGMGRSGFRNLILDLTEFPSISLYSVAIILSALPSDNDEAT